MGKDKSKDRDEKRRTGKFYGANKEYIGIAELKGFYFGHGDHGSGNRFNRTVEKIAEYCRVEARKDIYNHTTSSFMGKSQSIQRSKHPQEADLRQQH